MPIGRRHARRLWAAAATVLTVVGASGTVRPAPAVAQELHPFENSRFLRLDPERVVLDERDSRVPCGECHVAEYEVWLRSKHAEGFNTIHRTDLARDILRDMGLRTAKRQESLCLKCHYTVKAPSLIAIAGVSCESCHGAARDWIDSHNDWGPGVEHPDSEAPAHREQRIRESTAGGMLRPSGDLYGVAANCFECHTVPVEDLVNVGGHPAGSANFALAERIAEIRHNFVSAQWGGSSENRAPSVERTRVTYVTGAILDYEYSIRGMARATREDRYAKAMERRITKAARALEAIGRAADVPEVRDVLAAGREGRFVPGSGDALLALADRIRTLGHSFTRGHDGTQLGSLDAVMAGGAAAAAPPGPDAQPALEGPPPAAGGGAPAAPRPQPVPPESTRSAPAAADVAGPSVVGRVRNRPEWFPAPDPRYQTTLASDECVNCHAVAEEWWYDDPHQSSALKLLNRDPKAVQIASLYGLAVNEMALGSRICMNCHGTIASAAPSVEVLLGVSCESCHGPSSGYLEPHEDGGNPQLGMTALKDARARAANCARCHHVTDERLLSSGHPSGTAYDVAAANEQIGHWPDERRVGRQRERRGDGPYPAVSGAALAAAYQAEIGSRPIPDVQVATLPPPRPGPPAPSGAASPPPATVRERPPVRTTGGERTPPPPITPVPRPAPRAARPAVSPAAGFNLSPLPPVRDDATVEEILLIVKRRLDELYRSLGRGR